MGRKLSPEEAAALGLPAVPKAKRKLSHEEAAALGLPDAKQQAHIKGQDQAPIASLDPDAGYGRQIAEDALSGLQAGAGAGLADNVAGDLEGPSGQRAMEKLDELHAARSPIAHGVGRAVGAIPGLIASTASAPALALYGAANGLGESEAGATVPERLADVVSGGAGALAADGLLSKAAEGVGALKARLLAKIGRGVSESANALESTARGKLGNFAKREHKAAEVVEQYVPKDLPAAKTAHEYIETVVNPHRVEQQLPILKRSIERGQMPEFVFDKPAVIENLTNKATTFRPVHEGAKRIKSEASRYLQAEGLGPAGARMVRDWYKSPPAGQLWGASKLEDALGSTPAKMSAAYAGSKFPELLRLLGINPEEEDGQPSER